MEAVSLHVSVTSGGSTRNYFYPSFQVKSTAGKFSFYTKESLYYDYTNQRWDTIQSDAIEEMNKSSGFGVFSLFGGDSVVYRIARFNIESLD